MSILKTFKDNLNNIIYPTTHAKAVYIEKSDGSVVNLQTYVSEVVDQKIAKVSNATNGNLAKLTSAGEIVDSGNKPSDYLGITLKGAANGVASLDSTGKVPKTQLPATWEKYVKNGKTSTSGSLDLFTISDLIITADTLIDDPYCDKQGVDYVEMTVTASTNASTANGSITVKYNTSDAVTKVSVLIMN